jgi:hypothetical protein
MRTGLCFRDPVPHLDGLGRAAGWIRDRLRTHRGQHGDGQGGVDGAGDERPARGAGAPDDGRCGSDAGGAGGADAWPLEAPAASRTSRP